MIQGIDYAAIAPPLILAVAAIGLLLADAFDLPRRFLGVACAGSLAAALVAVVALAFGDRRATFCVPSGLRGAGGGSGPASCSYVADDFTLLLQGVLLAAAVIVVLLSLREITASGLPAGEYHFLLLCAITGAVVLVASRDLITLVVALETLSLPVFALVALRRYDGVASEASLKLFLVSVVSAAIMLFGVSLLYGVTGAMHLDRMAAALSRTPADLKPVAAIGVVLVLAGFAFKIAAVPFHFWAPDVYQGAPIPVAAFLSVVSKAGGFAGLVILLDRGLPAYGHVWGPMLAVIAAVTMTLGNLVALRQRHAVRLLAWSSVAQSGYMLAPLAVGDRRLAEAVAATMAYVVLYAVMNIGAFAVVTAFAHRSVADAVADPDAGTADSGADTADAVADPGDGTADGRVSNELDDYRGLAWTNPLISAALALFLICLAGLPPGIMGLFAKIVVFRATVAGDVIWLAVVMAINTVIGLYYYLAWAVRLFTVRTPQPQVGPAVEPAAGPAAGPAVERAAGLVAGPPIGLRGGLRVGLPVGVAIAAAAAGAILFSVAPHLVLEAVSAIT